MSLPVVSGAEVVRALQRGGFDIVRVTGSHHRMLHPDDPQRATTVPVHGNKPLKRGTLRGIIRQAGLTVEEFNDLL